VLNATAEPAPVRIALYGDSTNEGIDGSTKKLASVTPAQALQTALERRFGAGRVLVVNRAISGTTSRDLAATDRTFDLVVINFGINDARLGVPLDEYRANLLALRRPGLVLKTPNPLHSRPYSSDAHAQAMREVAKSIGAPLIDTHAHVGGLLDWRRMVPDGVHPNAELYGLVAEDSARVLAPLIERVLAGRSAATASPQRSQRSPAAAALSA
jgi:lysophospholipase L1-like esterase